MNFKNKTILITGANRGIGRALDTTARDQRSHRNLATLVTPWRFDTASVFVHDHHALGHIENATKSQHATKEEKAMTTQVMHSGADELEVQRRDVCVQHASQAQQ
jgi:NAD(P)-dependent dehydrogenase (short-subunit alcohol dehydrogenase family)